MTCVSQAAQARARLPAQAARAACCEDVEWHPSHAAQERLSHKDIKATMIYTHVHDGGGKGTRGPPDAL